MIQINLLPDVKKEHLKAVRQKRIIISSAVIASGAFLAIVVLLAVTVFAVQKKHISDLTKDIDSSVNELRQVEDVERILTIQNQLTALPDLYNKKPNATNLFGYLSAITPDNIRLTSNKIDLKTGSAAGMELSGNTATFKDANRYVDIIKNARYKLTDTGSGEELTGQAFSKVVLETIGKNSGATDSSRGTVFTISVQYDKAIFDIKYDKVSLEVPSIVSSVSNNVQPFDNQTPSGGAQ